jgi:NAD(P)-dependent dehydrogenase (short-subunit alcohol dehydrogenase family)
MEPSVSAEPRRIVLVTGAGHGIGRATAARFAARGDRVIATVRDAERARALTDEANRAALPLEYLPLEFLSGEGLQPLVARVEDAGGLDVLVNNAGAGVLGAVEEVGEEQVQWQFAVNLFGPLALTRRVLPGLRRRRGHVIWVGSLAGRMALPFQAHYSATKAAIASLSDAMRLELAPHGVRVSCVEPSDFATGFTDARVVARVDGSAYASALETCLKDVEKQERGAPAPDMVARVIVDIAGRERTPVRRPVGQNARIICLLQRLLPARIVERMVGSHYGQ